MFKVKKEMEREEEEEEHADGAQRAGDEGKSQDRVVKVLKAMTSQQ